MLVSVRDSCVGRGSCRRVSGIVGAPSRLAWLCRLPHDISLQCSHQANVHVQQRILQTQSTLGHMLFVWPLEHGAKAQI